MEQVSTELSQCVLHTVRHMDTQTPEVLWGSVVEQGSTELSQSVPTHSVSHTHLSCGHTTCTDTQTPEVLGELWGVSDRHLKSGTYCVYIWITLTMIRGQFSQD